MSDTSEEQFSDVEQIRKMTQYKLKAAESQNIDKIMSVYWKSEDFVLYDPCPGQYVGWETLKTLFLDYFRTWPAMEASMEDLHVAASGDLGYAFSIQTWKFKKPDGEVDTFIHRITEIWRKFNGEWRCVHEHASLPMDILGSNRTASNEA